MSVATALDLPVGRMADERPDKVVRIDRDLADMVDFIIMRRSKGGRRMTVAQYLSPVLRAQVEADYAAEVEAQHRELRKQRPKG